MMVPLVIGGLVMVIGGVYLVVFRRRLLDARLRWYDEHMPKARPDRSLEAAFMLFGAVAVIAFGVVLIVIGVS